MNAIQLSKKIGLIDSDLVEEAANSHKRIRRNPWMKWAAVAAVFIVVGVTMFVSHQSKKKAIYPIQPSNAAVSNEKKVQNIKYSRSNQLDVISCTFNVECIGGEGNYGHLVVKDYSDVATANPTRNNVEGITELPVFKNERGLLSDAIQDINIKAQIYFDNPAYEVTRDYSFEGISSNTWNLCFKNDKSKGIVDQLLDYTFYRIEYAIYDLNDKTSGWSRTLKPPSEPGILYPIISEKEAEQKFRNGDFFSYGNEAEVAKTADIISVELKYRIDEYQTYIQPYYVFMINDKSWDISPMLCKNKKEFTSVSPVYVPALADKYLKITKPTFNYN